MPALRYLENTVLDANVEFSKKRGQSSKVIGFMLRPPPPSFFHGPGPYLSRMFFLPLSLA